MIVRGVVADQAHVDRAVVRRLAKDWKLERLDATLRAILRAGCFELIACSDAPTEVVIDEYVELAKSFFEGPEAGFVNAALDAIARPDAERRVVTARPGAQRGGRGGPGREPRVRRDGQSSVLDPMRMTSVALPPMTISEPVYFVGVHAFPS